MADRAKYRPRHWSPAIAPCVMAMLLTSPTALTAQATEPTNTLSLVSVGAPLDEALAALASEAHVSLVYDAELVRGKRAFCRRIDTAIEPLLSCILEGTGLDFHRLSSGTYVIREAPRSDAPGAVVGRVVDAVSGLPVSDANILLSSHTGGTASNGAGRFAVGSLHPGPRRVTVTHISYQDAVDSVFITPFGRSRLTVALVPRTRMVKPIVVSGFRERIPVSTYDHPSSQLDPHDLSNERSRDVLSSLDAISGVRFGDAMSDVHVQGGATGEHQYRLDGATLFVPLRNGGVVGPFSPFAIRQITIRKAGYGAGFGSQLSGVVEVDQEVGSADGIDAMIQADELAVNGRLSGRVGSEGGVRASWMIGGRRDLWDVYKPSYIENVIDEWSRPDTLLASLLQEDPVSAVPTGGSHTVGFSDLHTSVTVLSGL